MGKRELRCSRLWFYSEWDLCEGPRSLERISKQKTCVSLLRRVYSFILLSHCVVIFPWCGDPFSWILQHCVQFSENFVSWMNYFFGRHALFMFNLLKITHASLFIVNITNNIIIWRGINTFRVYKTFVSINQSFRHYLLRELKYFTRKFIRSTTNFNANFRSQSLTFTINFEIIKILFLTNLQSIQCSLAR